METSRRERAQSDVRWMKKVLEPITHCPLTRTLCWCRLWLSRWNWKRNVKETWNYFISKSSALCSDVLLWCLYVGVVREEAARMWRKREEEWESESAARDRLMAEVTS